MKWILKSIFIIAIVAVAMIGVMVPSVFAQSDVIFGKTVIENVTPSKESVSKPITIKLSQDAYVKGSDMPFNIRILDSFDKPIFIILKDKDKNTIYTKEVFAPTGEINVKLRLDFQGLSGGSLLELIVGHNENQQNKKFYISNSLAFLQFNHSTYTWTDTAYLTAIFPKANLDPLEIDSFNIGTFGSRECFSSDGIILYETDIDTMEFHAFIQFIPLDEETWEWESCLTQISNSPDVKLIVKEDDYVQGNMDFEDYGYGGSGTIVHAMIKPLEKEIIQHIHGVSENKSIYGVQAK